MSSYLGIVNLGAHSIALSMNTFLFLTFPFAIGNAASILVGTSTGEGKALEARRSCHISLVFSYLVQLSVISVLLLRRHEIASLFSKDEEVSDTLSKLIPIMCVFLFCDASVATAGGIFRGIGRQKWLLHVNLFGSWLLAMPVAWCLAFRTNLGIYGLWWGMSVGVIISAISCQYVLNVCIDWRRECLKSTERLSSLDISNKRSSCEPLLQDDNTRQIYNESLG
jgi:MATE family multidrug resistance protein